MIVRPPSPPPEPEPPAMPGTKRELLAAIRDAVGEIAEVPPDRRNRILQSLGSALQSDLELLYGALMVMRDALEQATGSGAPRRRGACACGAITTVGLLCPRCGTIAE